MVFLIMMMVFAGAGFMIWGLIAARRSADKIVLVIIGVALVNAAQFLILCLAIEQQARAQNVSAICCAPPQWGPI